MLCNLYNVGHVIFLIMYNILCIYINIYDQNNLLLRRMIVTLMLSCTQPSSVAVPASVTTVLGCVASLVVTALAAEPLLSWWPWLL